MGNLFRLSSTEYAFFKKLRNHLLSNKETNMELALTVFQQVIIMFLLIAVGIAAFKLKIIDEHANQKITKLLLNIVAPATIINAFFMEYDPQKLFSLGIAFVLAIASHLIGIALSLICVRKKNNPLAAVERFAAVYSNCGFMALPLCAAVFGSEGVFFASAYMIVFQFFSWSHGYLQLSGRSDKKAILKTLYSPAIIAVVIGLILYLTQLPVPLVISQTVSYVASLNTPLAMIVVGCTLAQSPVKDAFCRIRNYYPILLRNFLIPAVAAVIYSLIPGLSEKMILINILSTACPAAAVIVMFSKQFDKNVAAASQILTLSNIVSFVSIPVIMFITQKLTEFF